MRRLLAGMTMLLLMGGATSCELWQSSSRVYQVPTPSPSYAIVSNALPFHQIWRQAIGHSNQTGGSSAPIMTVAADTIVMPIMSEHETKLIALRAQDGKQLWTSKLDNPGFPDLPAGVMSILADSKRVYVTLLSFFAQAFDLTDGKLLWTSPALRSHTGYDIYPLIQNDTLQLYSSTNGTTVYNINAGDGKIKSTEDYPKGLIIKTSAIRCVDTDKSIKLADRKGLTCVNVNTNQALWSGHVPGGVQMWPVLTDSGTMIYSTLDYNKAILAIDLSSGKILWQTPVNVTSNIAVAGGAVYSIRTDAALVAQDAQTGRQLGLLQFSNGPLQKVYGTEYWVMASGDKLFVYFGDSQELLALAP